MPKSSKTKSSKKRVKVDKLAGKSKQLSAKEAKDVKGGILIGLSQPSQFQLQANTVGGALGSISGNTIGGSLAGNISNPSKP